ncbi:MAG: SusD/RagB family nutrient-binding outer membrane lipoprotein [Bacteroides sp.]
MNKIKALMVAVAALALTSCDSWLDVNTDPNYPSTIPTIMPITSGIGSAATVIGGQYAILGGLWGQHYTQNNTANQYKTWDSYNINSKFMNAEYLKLYAFSLTDFKKAGERSAAEGNWNYYLMATVMDAYIFQVLVDLYGTVPYFEACKADQGIVTPKFDSGEVIYADLLARLSDALSKDFSAPTCANPGKNDLVFGGDMDHWKEFANTLKLKIAIRQFNVKKESSTKIINELLDSKVKFLSTNASVTAYKDAPGNYNPLFDSDVFGLGNANLRASNTTLKFILSNNDPRLPYMYEKGSKKDYEGLDQGDYTVSAANQPAGTLSKVKIKADDPVVFMSQAESAFLQAEALLKCKAGVGTKEKYEEGVRLAFARYEIEEDKVNDLLQTGAAYAYEEANALKLIITQKWLSCFLSQGLEAFFEFNRTGFPSEFTVPKNSVLVNKTSFIQRLPFPEYELTSNKGNIPAEVNLDVPLWWAVK